MAQTTKKKNTSAPKRTTRQAAPTPPTPSPVPRTAGGLVCLLLALCVAVSYFDAQAVLLNHLRSVLTGLFGYGYWLWAALLLAGGLFLLLHRVAIFSICIVYYKWQIEKDAFPLSSLRLMASYGIGKTYLQCVVIGRLENLFRHFLSFAYLRIVFCDAGKELFLQCHGIGGRVRQ